MKKLTIILSLLGIAALTVITAWLGVGHVVGAMRRIGYDGFAILVLGQVTVNGVLGLAWSVCCPQIGVGRAFAARLVRDAAGNCLPFSQLGGMIAGIRATCFEAVRSTRRKARRSIGWPESVATNLVDITSEVMAQIVFILLALLCLIGHQGGGRYVWPLLGGMTILTLGIAGFIHTQRRGSSVVRSVARFFGAHIADGWRDTLVDNMDAFQAELDALWSAPARIIAGTTVHVAGWLGSATLTLLAYRYLGADLGFAEAVAIEGVVCGIMSAGFLVPASLGVQEGAYVALGLIFGVSADLSLGISLLRRGRDLTIGIPTLVIWQIMEVRRLRQTGSGEYHTPQGGFDSPPTRHGAS